MTKADMENEYWGQFLVWCANTPTGKNSDLLFWLDHNEAIPDNFWEWIIKCKPELLTAPPEEEK